MFISGWMFMFDMALTLCQMPFLNATILFIRAWNTLACDPLRLSFSI